MTNNLKKIQNGISHRVKSMKIARDFLYKKNRMGISEMASVLLNANDTVVGFDLENKITFWNNAAQNMYGYTAQEVMGKNIFDLLKTIYFGTSKDKIMHKLIKEGKIEAESVRQTKDGHLIYIESHSMALKDASGRLTGFASIHRDITHHKQSETKLKKYIHKIVAEKAKNEALLLSMGSGVVATDTRGKILFANDAMYKFLDDKHEDVRDKNIMGVLHLRDVKYRNIKIEKNGFLANLKSDKPVSKNFICINRNKKVVYVNITTSPIFMHHKLHGYISIVRDMTKEMEIERSKVEFVSLASHQLRTPITEIGLSAEMLVTGMAGKVMPGQKKYLKNIQSGVKEITALIEILLNISRIEMGNFAIHPKPTNLPVLCDRLIHNFALQIKAKKLKLKKNILADIPAINIDARIFQLIFDNLFSNAIKYTPKGYVGVDLRKKDSKNIVIKIHDSGVGIPENQKHLVFAKLFRADNSLKGTKGYGLGLYIVKSVLEKSGGKIRFESKEGRGTAFYVTIPLKGMKRKSQHSLL